jgi:hypothetical protein
LLRSIPAATPPHRNLRLALLASIAAIAGLAVLLIALPSAALADAGSRGLLIAVAGGTGLAALRLTPRHAHAQAAPGAASMRKMQQEAQLGRLSSPCRVGVRHLVCPRC